jgi:hypothetical protein
MDHAAKYPCSLLGVVGANTERHQTLTDKFVLIRILWTQGLGEGVPQLLEDNYELFRLDIPITSFPRHLPEKSRKLLRWTIRPFELLSERGPQLLLCAFRK